MKSAKLRGGLHLCRQDAGGHLCRQDAGAHLGGAHLILHIDCLLPLSSLL
jgi:hypothetical protein